MSGGTNAQIIIRYERPSDRTAIRTIDERAFQRTTEANLVDALRRNCSQRISLVAVVAKRAVGHILLTPVAIKKSSRAILGMGLAPLAVLPEFQRQGIGTNLVKSALIEVQKAKYLFVVVLGHPSYYARFGFVPAAKYGVVSEYKDIPDEAFMMIVYPSPAIVDFAGVAKYRLEFADFL